MPQCLTELSESARTWYRRLPVRAWAAWVPALSLVRLCVPGFISGLHYTKWRHSLYCSGLELQGGTFFYHFLPWMCFHRLTVYVGKLQRGHLVSSVRLQIRKEAQRHGVSWPRLYKLVSGRSETWTYVLWFQVPWLFCCAVLPHPHAALLDKRAHFYVGLSSGFFFSWRVRMCCMSTEPYSCPHTFATQGNNIHTKQRMRNQQYSFEEFLLKIFFLMWKVLHECMWEIQKKLKIQSLSSGGTNM